MSKSIQFAGGNNITLSTATALNATSITISGAAAGGAQTAISGLSNSEVMYTSGTVKLSDLANITIRSTTGQAFQFSVHPQQTGISGISNSETTYTSGTVGLSVVGGAMTIRSTTGNAFQFSVSQSVQAETQTAISGIANSETTYTSGTVSLSALGALTIRSTTGNQYQFSVNSQTNQSAIKALGASNVGNTAGNTGVSTGIDWVIAATTNLTVSESTVAGGPNTLWLSGPAAGAGGSFSGGISNLGNTAGSTGVTGTRLVFAGTNDISLSGSTDANGGTVSINFTRATLSQWNFGYPPANVNTAGGNSNGSVFALPVYAQHHISGSRVDGWVNISISSSSNSSHGGSISWGFGIFTKNVSTLSAASSTSSQFVWTNTSNNSLASLSGVRRLSLPLNINMTPGNYWMVCWSRSSSANANWWTGSVIANTILSASATNILGDFGAAAATTAQPELGLGEFSVSTAAFPVSIALSDMSARDGIRYPYFAMHNWTA